MKQGSHAVEGLWGALGCLLEHSARLPCLMLRSLEQRPQPPCHSTMGCTTKSWLSAGLAAALGLSFCQCRYHPHEWALNAFKFLRLCKYAMVLKYERRDFFVILLAHCGLSLQSAFLIGMVLLLHMAMRYFCNRPSRRAPWLTPHGN